MIPGWITLAKAALWVLLIGTAVAGVGYGVHLIHADGKAIANAECIKARAEFDATLSKEVADLATRLAAEKDANNTNLLGALDGKAKATADLTATRAAYAATNRGLWVNTQGSTCTNATSPETEGPSESVPGAGKTRLSEGDERFLVSIANDADDTTTNYDTLRKVCLPLVEVVE